MNHSWIVLTRHFFYDMYLLKRNEEILMQASNQNEDTGENIANSDAKWFWAIAREMSTVQE